jgi:hypothetical protein
MHISRRPERRLTINQLQIRSVNNMSEKPQINGVGCGEGSTFAWGGDEYQKLADLGDGWALIAHKNGPCISNGDAISVIDIYDAEPLVPRQIKMRAQRAFREWAWPRLKAGLTFPDYSLSNT